MTMAQMAFLVLSDRYASLHAKRDPPVDAVVPWEGFRPELARVWRTPAAERSRSRAGRKPMGAAVQERADAHPEAGLLILSWPDRG